MQSTRRQFLVAATAAPAAAAGELDFRRLVPERVPRSAAYRQEGWCLWDPATVRTSDGTCHLLYSRWPLELGFDAWATHAEIAWATAAEPEGPYAFRGVVMAARGAEHWDGHSVYNTCLLEHGGKFYLYYTGNHGPVTWRRDRALTTKDAEWWVQRNNQRIGVAVADHPGGPWKRFEKPLIEVGPETGQRIIAVPNIVARPEGGFLLAYKTLAAGEGPFGGGVFHYVAVGESPLGPFRRHPVPMVDKSKVFHRHFNFHIDDHFEWYQDGRYWAIVKDHDAPFLTEHGRCLYLLESDDGLTWRRAAHTLVKDFWITWDDGRRVEYERLEMPKLYLDGGRPRVLFLAALEKGAKQSHLVAMPLKWRKERSVQ